MRSFCRRASAAAASASALSALSALFVVSAASAVVTVLAARPAAAEFGITFDDPAPGVPAPAAEGDSPARLVYTGSVDLGDFFGGRRYQSFLELPEWGGDFFEEGTRFEGGLTDEFKAFLAAANTADATTPLKYEGALFYADVLFGTPEGTYADYFNGEGRSDSRFSLLYSGNGGPFDLTGQNFSLTVAPAAVAAAVPESGTLFLASGALTLAGAGVCRRRRKAGSAAAA